jgi:hypothetical protein
MNAALAETRPPLGPPPNKIPLVMGAGHPV